MFYSLQILYACYTAIGARRSTHSAIIGDSTVVAIEPLGARRETACLALADRAVAMLASAYQTLIARSPQPKLGVMAMIKTMLLCEFGALRPRVRRCPQSAPM